VIKDTDLKNNKVYICGSKAMIGSTLKLLGELSVDEENISYESA